MSAVTIDFAELEAMNDVLEAARCYWYERPELHVRATEALRRATAMYWRLGEHLPRTGMPSDRFAPVRHSSSGDDVEAFLEAAVQASAAFNQVYDPWFADAVVASREFATSMPKEQLARLRQELLRLGLVLELSDKLLPDRVQAERHNTGPWPEGLDDLGPEDHIKTF